MQLVKKFLVEIIVFLVQLQLTLVLNERFKLLLVLSLSLLVIIKYDNSNELRSNFRHSLLCLFKVNIMLKHVFFKIKLSLALCLLQSLQ